MALASDTPQASWELPDTELTLMGPDRIDQRDALANKQLTGPVQHQDALLLARLQLDKAHRRPGYSLQIASASAASFFWRFTNGFT